MITTTAEGGNRSEGSISGASVLAAFIPALVTAVIYLGVFTFIRNNFRKFYIPRTFLKTIPEKDWTPHNGTAWWTDLWRHPDRFILQHNSLDAYLYLRFLVFIVSVCFLGTCITWPILFPINATGGGSKSQLDRLSFSNIAKNNHLWAHVVLAWVMFLGLLALIARERLRLIGIRQAYLLDPIRGARVSSRTVLYLNAPPEACQTENTKEYFGEDVERIWPVIDTGDLDNLISARNGIAFALEKAEMDLIIAAVKHHNRTGGRTDGADPEEGDSLLPKSKRPTKRKPPVVGSKFDPIELARRKIGEVAERIDKVRASPSRNVPGRSAVFVAFSSQEAAHRAYQRITFPPPMPVQDRFLGVQPKEVLWNNLALPIPRRLSKASLALVFVIAFTIFFSIPVGIIGTISNVKYLANQYKSLSWLKDLPPVVMGLLTGLVPPYLTSWFVSYVPKLFRHIAKLSGEPTTAQAELKTQAWYFAFQVFQVFLVTTFSSGAAAVAAKIAKDPQSAPTLLAESLPMASNFYITYFILQGLGSASSTIVNYSDLFEYLFYEYVWDKSPREKFQTYASMKGTPWASWFPKFTNFLVIAIAYSCVAPIVLGFATVGIFLYYLAYRHQMLYVVQAKVDTRGEAYKRALQHMPTGIYLAELCLIGLMGARKAAIQTTLMTVLLVITALVNLFLDRVLRPLELYLGVDIWQEQEPALARADGVDENDPAAAHAASHGRRLGLQRLPGKGPRIFSDLFDSTISAAREQTESWIGESVSHDENELGFLTEEELEKAYKNPALTSKTPKLWIPRDSLGVSKREIEQNQADGLPTTDDEAEFDDEGSLVWNHDFEAVPIWSKPRVI